MHDIEGISSTASKLRQSRRWSIIVAALLFCHALLIITVFSIVVRNPSLTILPDYYQKALNWDQNQARRLESAKLGWIVTIDPVCRVDPSGARSVKFLLRDKNDQPIRGAALTISYFHHAQPTEVATVELKESAPGEFTARLPIRQAGFWQFDLSATTTEHAFTTSVIQFIETDVMR